MTILEVVNKQILSLFICLFVGSGLILTNLKNNDCVVFSLG